MKLSNQQVNALAEKIKSNLLESKAKPIKEFNQSIYDSEEYKKFYETNPDCIYLDELYKTLNMSSYHFDNIKSQIKSDYFRSKFKEVPSFNVEKIINEIHLQTIEIQNLDELITKVSEKFK